MNSIAIKMIGEAEQPIAGMVKVQLHRQPRLRPLVPIQGFLRTGRFKY
jgi:hypothetical protein